MDKSIDSQKSKSFNFESKDIKRDNPSILNAKIQKPSKLQAFFKKVTTWIKQHPKLTILALLSVVIIIASIITAVIFLSQSKSSSETKTTSWSDQLSAVRSEIERLQNSNEEHRLTNTENYILDQINKDPNIDHQIDLYVEYARFWNKYGDHKKSLDLLLNLNLDNYTDTQKLRHYRLISSIYNSQKNKSAVEFYDKKIRELEDKTEPEELIDQEASSWQGF